MTICKSKTYILFLSLWAFSVNGGIINSIKSYVVPTTNFETYGIWSEKETGLGHKIWKRSNRATVEALLSTPWTSFASPALYKLALRLLLTSTEVPAPEASSVNLLEMRAQRLYELGEITYAYDLIKGFSANVNPVLFNKIKFSALLAQQKYDEALKIALVQAPKSHEVFWQEAIIFCQLFNPDQQESARLALSIYRDNPKIADPEFVLLVEHILGKKQKNIPVSSTHSFMKLLLRLKAGLLPDSLIALVSPRYLSLLHTYRDFVNLSSISRIRAHERMGLFVPPNYGTPLLQVTYAEASRQEPCPFDAAADPIGNDPLLLEDAPLVRAHLFQLLSSATDPSKKTAYAVLLLRNALKHKLLVPISYLIEPFLKELNATDPAMQPYILLARTVLKHKQDIKTATQVEDPVLLTILLLHYPEDGLDQHLWQNKFHFENSPHRHILAGVMYPWHKTLGQKLVLALWKHQADFDPEMNKSPFLLNFLLSDARLRKQTGEVIALTLLLSTYEDGKSKTIGSLPYMLRALHRVGLEQPALELAMEKLSTLVAMPDLSLANPLMAVPVAPQKPVAPKAPAPKHAPKAVQ